MLFRYLLLGAKNPRGFRRSLASRVSVSGNFRLGDFLLFSPHLSVPSDVHILHCVFLSFHFCIPSHPQFTPTPYYTLFFFLLLQYLFQHRFETTAVLSALRVACPIESGRSDKERMGRVEERT